MDAKNADKENEDEFLQNFAKIRFDCVIPEVHKNYKEYCIGFLWDKKGGLKCEHFDLSKGCTSSVCGINAAVNYLKGKGVWRK